MVGARGLEPRLEDSESPFLPIERHPNRKSVRSIGRHLFPSRGDSTQNSCRARCPCQPHLGPTLRTTENWLSVSELNTHCPQGTVGLQPTAMTARPTLNSSNVPRGPHWRRVSPSGEPWLRQGGRCSLTGFHPNALVSGADTWVRISIA